MATILTIFFWILPNFELKLEIPNIMLMCKFEINWSKNKNLRALTTYLGRTDYRTDARHFQSSKLGKIQKKIVRMVAIFKMSAKTHQNFKVLQFQRKLIFRRFSTWGMW
jgi:hypothetical protein